MSCDRRCFDEDAEYIDCDTCPGRDDGRHTKESFRDVFGDDSLIHDLDMEDKG